MCIICVKDKGVKMPTKEIFETMFRNNPDGSGLAYSTTTGETVIKKGFMDFKSFYKGIKLLQKEIDTLNTPMIFHFRIGTAGTNSKGLTHPFPLGVGYKEMKKTNLITSKGAMFHNGMLHDFESKDIDLYDVNDSMIFTKTVINQLPNDWYNNKHLKYMLKVLIGTNKLAFLINGKITLIGKFINDTETGLKFSNTTYQKSYLYNDWYDDNYWQKWYDKSYSSYNYGYDNSKNTTSDSLGFYEVSPDIIQQKNLTLFESDDMDCVDYYTDDKGNYYEYDRLTGKMYRY